MPIERSPPPTPTTPCASVITQAVLHHSASDSSLINNEESTNECDFSNVTQRIKRKCTISESDHDNQLSIFMCEMKTMFLEFKEQQNKKFEKICEAVEEIKLQNLNIQSTVTFLSQDYDILKKQIDQLEAQLETERKNNLLYSQTLEDKLEKLERGARATCVEIRNVPVNKSESKDCLLNTVGRIGSLINVPIQVHQVKDIYRIGSKNADNKTIIVDFTTNLLKEKVIQMYRKYNKEHSKLSTEHLKIGGPAKPVFVSENLTPKMKRLFFLARDFANNNEYRYCWIKNGKIYLREKEGATHLHIKDESDFLKLKTDVM